jgi:hypothetical protein
MSDALKHECGIALIRLLKPLELQRKYGTAFYGIQKCIFSKSSTTAARWWFCKYKLDVEAGNVTLVVYVRIMHNHSRCFCSNKRQNK